MMNISPRGKFWSQELSDLKHLGMWVDGVQDAGRKGRLLIARNKASGRAWIVDPRTGIGEPAPDDRAGHHDGTPPAPRRPSAGPSASPSTGENAQPGAADAGHLHPAIAPGDLPDREELLEPPELDEERASGGPFDCQHCGQRKLYVLCLADHTTMLKCLGCRRFVVDGRQARPPRTRRQALSRREIARRRSARRKARRVKAVQSQALREPALPLEATRPDERTA